MLINKTLEVIPAGIIEGGKLRYDYDEHGRIEWAAAIVATFLFFSKTFKYNGVVQIDPEYLRSENIVVGTKLNLGNLHLVVEEVKKPWATGKVTYQDSSGNNLTGSVVLDLSGQNVQVESIVVNGIISGQSVQIGAK